MTRTQEQRKSLSPAVNNQGTRPKIAITGLTRRFKTNSGTVTALDNVSMNIADGSFFVIVGPSGCGKTTLLRILAGLDQPTEGSVDIDRKSPAKPINSMVFQGESIFPWMTVWDNAAFGLKARRVANAEITDTVKYFLDRTGLTPFADAFPHQLSGGMKQRVSIARAFANDPEILLMDEPFSALDEQNKTILQQELLRIWDETRKTVLFITHSVDEAITLGDQIMIMTAAPGRLKSLLTVPFERPRNVIEMRANPEYGTMVREIWQYLAEEVSQSNAVAPRKQDISNG